MTDIPLQSSTKPSTGPEPEFLSTFRFWVPVFILLAAVRYAVGGFEQGDALLVHSRIVDSLLAGHNWGRQALVGSPEYPLLPTLALLLARVVGSPLGADPGRMLASICQAWALCILLRSLRPGANRWAFAALGCLVVFASDFIGCLRSADPNWVSAVAVCSMVRHVDRWYRGRLLRDAVVTAVWAGLLAFAGIPAAAFAAAVLIGLSRDPESFPGGDLPDTQGVVLLLLAPFTYCLFLWLLWNRLILDDALFPLKSALSRLGIAGLGEWFSGTVDALAHTTVLVAGAGAVVLLHRRTGGSRAYFRMLIGLLAVVSVAALLVPWHIYGAGRGILAPVVAVAIILRVVGGSEWASSGRIAKASAAAVLITVAAARLLPSPTPARAAAFAGGVPAAEEMVTLIDRYWPDSRIAVYGVRAAAVFHDPAERRFVARMDFHEGVFLAQAADEQMHLLIPPPDGPYYLGPGAVFADIHRRGRSWLLLERTWPSGWQLWRCVLPPEGESKLLDLD